MMMSLLRQLASVTFIGLFMASGCQDDSGSPSVSSETHFLAPCTDECGGGLECICGVCTRACSTDQDCPGLNPDAQCLPACSASAVSPVCDMSCEADQDCDALGPDLTCAAGRCRTPSPEPPISMVDTADEFCRAEVELLTEYSSRCSGAALDSWRLLLDADFICGNAGEAEQNGRLSFSADDAQACVEAMTIAVANVDCGVDPGVLDLTQDSVGACERALQGAVPLGGVCRSFHILELFDECPGDTYCDQGGVESCAGTCTAYLGEGDACELLGSGRCAPGLSCSQDVCMVEAELDAPCEGPEAARCADGLYCEGGGTDQEGVCRAEKTSGPCVDAGECATAHFCNADGSCEPYHQDGEACTPGAGECYPGLSFCDAGTCALRLRALGESCGSIEGESLGCLDGYCDAPSGEQGVCQPKKAPGEACTASPLGQCAGNAPHCDETTGQCANCDAP